MLALYVEKRKCIIVFQKTGKCFFVNASSNNRKQYLKKIEIVYNFEAQKHGCVSYLGFFCLYDVYIYIRIHIYKLNFSITVKISGFGKQKKDPLTALRFVNIFHFIDDTVTLNEKF